VRLLSVEIQEATGSGGLLNGLALGLRGEEAEGEFAPLCFIGPNGSGKSQFLQTLAEIFQAAWHACAPAEERAEANPSLCFTVRYLIRPNRTGESLTVEVSRQREGRRIGSLRIRTEDADGTLRDWAHSDPETRKLLPSRVVAYTSGENETLSQPFFLSRTEYADAVSNAAKPEQQRALRARGVENPAEPRLMLIDYSTHFEVLVANLLLGTAEQRQHLLAPANLEDLRSVRCVVQLAHRAAPSGGVLLTPELKECIEKLKACATCWNEVPSQKIYTFDFWVDEQVRLAFKHHFGSAFELYRLLHKLALLNDLAISRPARQRFKGEVRNRRFASRLPEPPDEDKVFKFEQVTFRTTRPVDRDSTVDYVSLSDGEHQLAQVVGVFAMVSEPEVLFLLDEPESHFNPQWRVDFLSRLMRVPTEDGTRDDPDGPRSQEVLLTTHAPFVPSDMPRERVIIFERSEDGIAPRNPDIQTFGASYEEILDHCFRVHPPISNLSMKTINELKQSEDVAEVRQGIEELGPSVEKVLLVDHLRQLQQD